MRNYLPVAAIALAAIISPATAGEKKFLPFHESASSAVEQVHSMLWSGYL